MLLSVCCGCLDLLAFVALSKCAKTSRTTATRSVPPVAPWGNYSASKGWRTCLHSSLWWRRMLYPSAKAGRKGALQGSY